MVQVADGRREQRSGIPLKYTVPGLGMGLGLATHSPYDSGQEQPTLGLSLPISKMGLRKL